ncbi:hypothetical protein TKK_0004576 [Trichogramma kaykai]|uniref:U3 small nucleolar RNA-interacting protein 2 n=1 Tax=Trichogramma kaykai TaxID=54128 RepID=A0ABD2XMV7_9HYME
MSNKQAKKRPQKRKFKHNEIISSSDEEFDEQNGQNQGYESESESEEETAQQKKIRLAKQRIAEVEEEEQDRLEFDRGAIDKRLHEEYLEEKGRLRKNVADSYTGHEEIKVLKCKDHRDPITCCCLTSDGQTIFSGSKDGSIVKWSVSTHKKISSIKRQDKTNKDGLKYIRCLAVSSDGKYLVAGSNSKFIHVYNATDLKHLKNLQGHRDVVSGLVFRKNTHFLYSASMDRCVKEWNLDDMAYVQSLFGHQSGITSIDALSKMRAITSGGFDTSVRIWKITEESQLIFQNNFSGSIDEVKLINEENFLSCADDGTLCVWSAQKKKPLCHELSAHGIDETNGLPICILSVATLLNTDLVASGCRNGTIKLWKVGNTFKTLQLLFEIKIPGCINSLSFTPDGKQLVAAVSQEPKLGRWWRIPEAKSGIYIIPLTMNAQNNNNPSKK